MLTKAICNAGFSGYFNHSSSLQHRQFVFDDLAIKTKIGINELAQWQPDNELFQSPALHIVCREAKNRQNKIHCML